MAELTIRYDRGGIHLPQLGLWLDSHAAQKGPERVFVSHAHSDHIGAHREVILTDSTARLMKVRVSGQRQEHRLGYRERASFGNGHGEISFQITLLPAGHIFGSAMALIEAGGESLLYTGDFKLRSSHSTESCEPRNADILIMETTFGRARYKFPPAEEVWASIAQFCRQTLEEGRTPVLLAYSLGKSQELLHGLVAAGFPVALHLQAHRLTQIYGDCGQSLPAHELLDLLQVAGKVVVCPPGTKEFKALQATGRLRTAMVTGWALDSSCRYRYGVDAAFPLSDHADFPDLVEFVRRVSPKRIYTLHGFAADFAQTLRELGFDARPLSEEDQLFLPLTAR